MRAVMGYIVFRVHWEATENDYGELEVSFSTALAKFVRKFDYELNDVKTMAENVKVAVRVRPFISFWLLLEKISER